MNFFRRNNSNKSANNGTNNGKNNGTNNGKNNGTNNGKNNGTNNGKNNGTNNGKNNGDEHVGGEIESIIFIDGQNSVLAINELPLVVRIANIAKTIDHENLPINIVRALIKMSDIKKLFFCFYTVYCEKFTAESSNKRFLFVSKNIIKNNLNSYVDGEFFIIRRSIPHMVRFFDGIMENIGGDSSTYQIISLDTISIPFFEYFVTPKKIHIIANSVCIDDLTLEQMNEWVELSDTEKIISAFYHERYICENGHETMFISNRPIKDHVACSCSYCNSYLNFISRGERLYDFPFRYAPIKGSQERTGSMLKIFS